MSVKKIIEYVLLEDAPPDLKIIKNVRFTTRHVDILACLLNGRNTQTISEILPITPKTAEAHIENIKQRSGCFSRQHLLSFIEKSGKSDLFNQHYACLRNNFLFECALKKISQNLEKPTSVYFWSQLQTEEHELKLLDLLSKHLKFCGIKIIKGYTFKKKVNSNWPFRKPDRVVCCFSSEKLNDQDRNFLESKIIHLLKNSSFWNTRVFPLLLNDKAKESLPEPLGKLQTLSFPRLETYYDDFFRVLKGILPKVDLDAIIFRFQEEASKIQSDISCTYSGGFFHRVGLPHNISKRSFVLGASGLTICLFLGGIFISLSFKGPKTLRVGELEAQKDFSIRSDLPLPHESTLLNRSQILKIIDEKLKKQEGIQTIALMGVVGIGGAGKTTLARQYARAAKDFVVWEINAETHASLVNSFEDLARAIAETEAEKRELRLLSEIKNPEKRERDLFLIIKKKLRNKPSWLLIYDNVENVGIIKRYFPSDPKVWGNGKVIVTTRDKNFKNNTLVNSEAIIDIETLSPKEQFQLFKNILYGKAQKINSERKQEIENFLPNLPPFPLDISTAAYYIKDTKISFEEYIERSSTVSKDFERAKTSLLGEVSNCSKTRYGIISLTLDKLIKDHPDFIELLLFISLVDSQNIPLDLLKSLKSETTVERFIHKLHMHSFITKEASINAGRIITISVHRSTQSIIAKFLSSLLKLTKNKIHTISIGNCIEKYISHTADVQKMKLTLEHGKAFLNHKNLLCPLTEESIKCELGDLCVWIDNSREAKIFLIGTFPELNKRLSKFSDKVFRLMMNRAYFYNQFGKYNKSLESFEKGLAIHETYSPNNIFQKIKVSVFMGDVNYHKGNYKKAKEFYEKSLKLLDKFPEVMKKNKRNKLSLYLSLYPLLAGIYIHFGKYKEAVNLIKKSSLNNSNLHKRNGSFFTWYLEYMGKAYNYMGLYERAKIIEEKVIKIRKKIYGDRHKKIAFPTLYLSFSYNKLGNHDMAKNLAQESLNIHKKYYGDNHIDTTWSMISLGQAYNSLGQYENAKVLLSRACELQKKFYGENHLQLFWVLECLGEAYGNLGQFKKAKKHLFQALQISEKQFGKTHVRVAEILKTLGNVYLLEKQLKTAEENYLKSLKFYENDQHPDIYDCLESLGDLYLKKAKRAKEILEKTLCMQQAKKYYKKSFSVLEKYFPKDCLHLKRLKSKITDIPECPSLSLLDTISDRFLHWYQIP